MSISRACSLVNLSRSIYYYRSKRDDTEVIEKLSELSISHPTRGFDCYFGRIRAEGYCWNRKRVLRVYRFLKLTKRRPRKRRLPSRNPEQLAQPISSNKSWSMDFMSDSLENGRRIRVLNVIDDFNREALWVDPQYSYPSELVIRALEILEMERGLPEQIRVDNGPEFISNKLAEYCKSKNIKLEFIQPGKPTQNAYIERFNRLFREDVLDAYLFDRISSVRVLCHKWKDDYNNNHPHKSLGKMSPIQFKILNNKSIPASEKVKAI